MVSILSASKRLVTPERFQKTCRICFTYGNLYDTKISMYEGQTIAEVLCGMINVYKFKLTEDYQGIEDPQFVCFGCITNLITAKLFFNQCSKARETLEKINAEFTLNQQKSVIISKPIYLYRRMNTIIMQRCNLNRGCPKSLIELVSEAEENDSLNTREEIIDEIIQETKNRVRKGQKEKSHKNEYREIKEKDERNYLTDIDSPKVDQSIKQEAVDISNNKNASEESNKNDIIIFKSDDDSSEEVEESSDVDIAYSDDKRLKIKDRKKYRCNECGIDFVGFRPFCRHNRDKHPKSYNCNICKKKFTNCLQLARHRWTHLQLECDICHKKMKKSSLKAHMKIHEKDYKPTPYKNVEKLCPLCGKILSISSWKDHLDSHIKPKKYKCKLCSFASSFGPSLKRHQAVHTGEKPFLCTNCGYTCNQKVALENHLKQHVISDTPLICQFCPETFRTRYDRRLHSLQHGYGSIASKITTNKTECTTGNESATKPTYKGPQIRAERNTSTIPNVCDVCNKTFKSKSKLKEHVLVHTGERPHKCEFCSSAFKQQQQLTAHTMRMHVVHESYRPFMCEICNKGFKYRQALNSHALIHTGEKPYKCDLCPSAFRQYPHLITHKQRIHDDRKPFSCEYCDKAFKCGLSLKEHIRTHTGETIECEHCDKTFKQSSTKYKHLREVHNIRRSTAM